MYPTPTKHIIPSSSSKPNKAEGAFGESRFATSPRHSESLQQPRPEHTLGKRKHDSYSTSPSNYNQTKNIIDASEGDVGVDISQGRINLHMVEEYDNEYDVFELPPLSADSPNINANVTPSEVNLVNDLLEFFVKDCDRSFQQAYKELNEWLGNVDFDAISRRFSPSNRNRSYIPKCQVEEEDVYCSRQNKGLQHPGNMNFLRVVEDYAAMFHSFVEQKDEKKRKRALKNYVLLQVLKGRFLVPCIGHNMPVESNKGAEAEWYYLMTEEEALEKVRNALSRKKCS